MLRVVNDNKLGSHVIMERVPVINRPPINNPPHKVIRFKIRNDYVPDFKGPEPLAYNPGEKPGPQNSYTNNWQKVESLTTPVTKESAIHDWFRQ